MFTVCTWCASVIFRATRSSLGDASRSLPARLTLIFWPRSVAALPPQTPAAELGARRARRRAGRRHSAFGLSAAALRFDSRRQAAARERVASLGLRDRTSGRAYLFDATPDFAAQVHALTGGRAPDGIFLTHAHIGHYTGLMYLGRESIGARAVPVHATAADAGLPDRERAVESARLARQHRRGGRSNTIAPSICGGGVRVTAFRVPHRDEFSDTVGYRIEGPRRTAIFIPDIDRWEKWDRSVRAMADTVDLAFLDGTFASPTEVNRNIEEIPHPMMPVTREL